VPGWGKTGCIRDPVIQRIVHRNIQVYHRIAVIADKMIMRLYAGLKPVKRAPKVDFVDKSLFDQNIEVAVDCPHAEIGKLIFQLMIQPVCGRVNICIFENFKDTVTLFAVSYGIHKKIL